MRFRDNLAFYVMTAVVSLTPLLSACDGQSNKEVWRNQADDRWRAARSALIYDVAEQRFQTGDLRNAESELAKALAIDPTNPRLNTLAGRIAMEQGKLERAYHLYQAAIAGNENYAPAYYFQAIVNQRWKRFDQALTDYQKAYELMPDHPPYLLAVAETMVSLGQRGQAIDLLSSKLQYFDQNASIRGALAHLHMLEGQHDKALSHFREAMLLDPENQKLREELAMALLTSRDYRAAAKAYADIIAELPTTPVRRDLHLALAKCYEELGQDEELREIYLKLARSESSQPEDWLKLSELAWADGDLGGTLTAANRVIRLMPENPKGYLMAGLVWQERGRVRDAVAMFDRAASVDPTNAEALILRGIILQREGHSAAAVQAFEKAVERQPNDQRAVKLLQSMSAAQ